MNYTNKTNLYRISLYVIIRITSLNIGFFIGFAFVFSETYLNHHSVLSSLWQFYYEGDIPNKIFAGTNYEKALIRIFGIVFPQIEHKLCFWHVDKNVLANYKPAFDIKEL